MYQIFFFYLAKKPLDERKKKIKVKAKIHLMLISNISKKKKVMYLYGFNRNNKYEMEIFTQIVLRFASHFARCGKINKFLKKNPV